MFDPNRDALIDLKRDLGLPSWVANLLSGFLKLDRLNAIYRGIRARCWGGQDFFRAGMDEMEIQADFPEGDVLRIPVEGPLVVVANHPFGAKEAFVLMDFILKVRPDVKLVANELLLRMPEIKTWLLPVNPFGDRSKVTSNMVALKQGMAWLKQGGCLVVFPSGAVSHLGLRERTVTDPGWSPHIGMLIRKSQASVLPVYFEGRNSWFFQIAGLVHPGLRTLLLPRELVRSVRRGDVVHGFAGRVIPWAKLEKYEDARSLVNFLRVSVYLLQARAEKWRVRREKARAREVELEPVAEAVSRDVLAAELGGLPKESLLLHQAGFSVYAAFGSEIPGILAEIGRLREMTFRAVGEGTGKASDTDRFDGHYLHLFLWNEVEREVAGAYRLGLSDRVLPVHGRGGFYTSTLFRYRPNFLARMGCSIELGRSFVRPEYQRKYNSLLLLWRGIGAYVAKNPQYRTLFGPVSISQDYHAISRNLMVQFLRERHGDDELGRLVKASRRPRGVRTPGLPANQVTGAVEDIDAVSALVAEIEDDGKGVPVLLRHYLKMNASIVCFNEDRLFSDVWDGLIVVDLAKTDFRLLQRFLGRDEAAGYVGYHRSLEMALEVV